MLSSGRRGSGGVRSRRLTAVAAPAGRAPALCGGGQRLLPSTPMTSRQSVGRQRPRAVLGNRETDEDGAGAAALSADECTHLPESRGSAEESKDGTPG